MTQGEKEAKKVRKIILSFMLVPAIFAGTMVISAQMGVIQFKKNYHQTVEQKILSELRKAFADIDAETAKHHR